ncbi:ferrochelatase [bacterium SCSIO 12741]|nr:ferrochelatase [bacterium SCSIO 12741]
MSKTTVLLINLGTPDNPSVGAVRKYLFQFLNDPRVIDIPALLRFMLVNLIIVPFRAPKSAKVYQELWTDKGSPLMFHGESIKHKLQAQLGDEYQVELAMRYQNPGMPEVLEKIRKSKTSKLIVIPLYPQYASSTTGSTVEEAMRIISQWYVMPEIRFVGQFYDHPGYLQTIVEQAKKYDLNSYDHILFSYHGLPTRQVDKVYDDGLCSDRDCEHEITDENQFCYKATCYATTRLIAERLNLNESQYSVGFQSRLDKNWLEPFSDKTVIQKAKDGCKRMLVFSPAFVADCLETTVEIGSEYKELFEEHGGETLDLVESLNDHPKWIDTLEDLVKNG